MILRARFCEELWLKASHVMCVCVCVCVCVWDGSNRTDRLLGDVLAVQIILIIINTLKLLHENFFNYKFISLSYSPS